MNRRQFISLLGGSAAWPFAARAQMTAPINWKLPSAYPVNNFHSENLGAFAKDLAEATGGKLAIKVFPNASLFPATAIKSAVRIGLAQSRHIGNKRIGAGDERCQPPGVF